MLGDTRAAHVLDVGANTGVYSRIAAASGATVVAWDSDVQAAELNWQSAHRAGLSILPLVADFARPTPALGWRNLESQSLLDRARGQFDCVLMLGILHHLLIADQIPLAAIVDQLSELSIRWVIVEWIPKGDSQFDELSRGRDDLYARLTEEYFLQSFAKCFRACCKERLPNGRTLWLMEKN
jgi:SAM-dependent methyltransferase